MGTQHHHKLDEKANSNSIVEVFPSLPHNLINHQFVDLSITGGVRNPA